jgi:hypothetical protein
MANFVTTISGTASAVKNQERLLYYFILLTTESVHVTAFTHQGPQPTTHPFTSQILYARYFKLSKYAAFAFDLTVLS